MFFRGFIENGDLRSAVETAKAGFRVYRLDQAESMPAMTFVNISGAAFNTIHANDVSFFQEVAVVVQEEPLEAVDPETRGLLASIGIQKGKPFEPDARMQQILTEAAAVGNATARALTFHTRDRKAYYYPNSAWKMWWIDDDFEFSPGGVLNLDGQVQYFYVATGSSPVFSLKMVGQSSQYAWATQDAASQYLDGGKSYRLHLPAGIPAANFWSILVYDSQTRSMLQTDQQFPSVSSQKKDLTVNPDTSVDVYFGPTPPAAPCRQGSKLGPDCSGQRLVDGTSTLQPTRAVVRQVLAARGDRADWPRTLIGRCWGVLTALRITV